MYIIILDVTPANNATPLLFDIEPFPIAAFTAVLAVTYSNIMNLVMKLLNVLNPLIHPFWFGLTVPLSIPMNEFSVEPAITLSLSATSLALSRASLFSLI